MRRGGIVLITLILLFAIFYGGRVYERRACRVDLPTSVHQIDNTVVCR